MQPYTIYLCSLQVRASQRMSKLHEAWTSCTWDWKQIGARKGRCRPGHAPVGVFHLRGYDIWQRFILMRLHLHAGS